MAVARMQHSGQVVRDMWPTHCKCTDPKQHCKHSPSTEKRIKEAQEVSPQHTCLPGGLSRVCVIHMQATIVVYKKCEARKGMQCSSLHGWECLLCPRSPRILGELFCKISNCSLINHASGTTSPYTCPQFHTKSFSIVAGGLH